MSSSSHNKSAELFFTRLDLRDGIYQLVLLFVNVNFQSAPHHGESPTFDLAEKEHCGNHKVRNL